MLQVCVATLLPVEPHLRHIRPTWRWPDVFTMHHTSSVPMFRRCACTLSRDQLMSVDDDLLLFLQLRRFFVQSSDRNPLQLFEDFKRHSPTLVAFHPLKQPWLMRAVHQQVLYDKQLWLETHLQQLQEEEAQLSGSAAATHSQHHSINTYHVTEDGSILPLKDGRAMTLKKSQGDALQQVRLHLQFTTPSLRMLSLLCFRRCAWPTAA